MPGGVGGDRSGILTAPYPDCAPSMGALLEVEVLPQAGHSERSETQLHEGDRLWEGSVERKS